MSEIKFGVTINAAPEMLYRSNYDSIKKRAQECERLGYDSLWERITRLSDLNFLSNL